MAEIHEAPGSEPGASASEGGLEGGRAPVEQARRVCRHCGADLKDDRAFVSRDGRRTICRGCFELRRLRAHRRVWLREQIGRGLVVLAVAAALVAVTFWFIGQQKPPRRRPPVRPSRQGSGIVAPRLGPFAASSEPAATPIRVRGRMDA